jgi:phytanoyl-CoA hydroxylase
MIEEARRQLSTIGYAVVADVLDPETVLEPLLRCLLQRLDRCDAQGLDQLHRELSAALVRHCQTGQPWSAQPFDISLPQGNIAPDTPMLLEPEVFALLSAPTLLSLVDELLNTAGPEVWLSPVGHVRLKTPERLGARADGLTGRVPWHQDNGVVLPEADDVEVLTVWVPLVEVTATSGCLQVLPTPAGSDIADHCSGPAGLSIPAPLLPASDPVPLEMKPGSALIMHSRTVHSSLPNLSERVRISYDLRYQRSGTPTGRPQFPSFLLRDGSGASCPATFEDWRDGWLATRTQLSGRQIGPFNRWPSDASICA